MCTIYHVSCPSYFKQVLEGKTKYLEFAGNLVPITKSGDQLQFMFRAFKENRLPFSVRVRDQHEDPVGRIFFMKDPKVSTLYLSALPRSTRLIRVIIIVLFSREPKEIRVKLRFAL